MSAKTKSLYREMLRSSRKVFPQSGVGLSVLRSKLRQGFQEGMKLEDRKEQLTLLEKGFNTLRFLKLAEAQRSTETRVLKSLCIMEHYKKKFDSPKSSFPKLKEQDRTAYQETISQYQQNSTTVNIGYGTSSQPTRLESALKPTPGEQTFSLISVR